MRRPYTQLYLHCVWATWNRLPLLTDGLNTQVYALLAAKCRELKCEPLAIGGTEDHVHILVRFHPTLSAADLIRELKGASSHFITHRLKPDQFFRRQGAYGAFSVGEEGVPVCIAYIRNQKEHHASSRLIPNWEQWEDTLATNE